MTREKAALFCRRKQAFSSSWRKPSDKLNVTVRGRGRMGREGVIRPSGNKKEDDRTCEGGIFGAKAGALLPQGELRTSQHAS